MGVLVLVWLALLAFSAIIGCRSFVYQTLNTRRCDFSPCRHIHNLRSLLSPSEPPITFKQSTKRPRAIAYLSNTGITEVGNIGVVSSDTTSDNDADDEEKEAAFGLYIHIPYCRQRCRYCDFAIVPIGDHKSTKTTRSDVSHSESGGETLNLEDPESRREEGFRRMNERYVSAIVAELKLIAARNTRENTKLRKVPLRSIYFGGGTPSLAPIESIESILYHACGWDNPEAPFRLLQKPQANSEETNNDNSFVESEITMEMDPGTFDRKYLSSLRDLGINRVSLGVQSFDDTILRAMGRTHRRADVLQAVRDIAFVFGKHPDDCKSNENIWENVNYSIDLISGCPGLTPAKWVETLQEATAGVEKKGSIDSLSGARDERQGLLLSSLPPPKHISVYDMQIEEGTVFGKWAAEAKKAATVKVQEDGQSYSPNHDDDDEDEDPSRQFTISLPLDANGEASGKVSSGLDSAEKASEQQRILRLPSEDECAFMYKYAAGYLRSKNYEHYEVSSYAAFDDTVEYKTELGEDIVSQKKKMYKPVSKRSKHNQIYWEYDGQWYAIGLGATSFIDKKSVARPRQMNDYIEWVSDGNEYMSANNKSDSREDEGIEEDFLSDILLKRLRTSDGLDLSWLKINYGSDIVEKVLEGANLGLDLGLAEHTDDDILRLTDPEGLLYSNFIISSIYAELGFM